MDWAKGFTYVFEDKRWFNKMFVGALITSVPVVEAITNGYQMQVIENIKAGNPQPLPEWKDMDRMFGRGFKLWLAVNMFYIPSTIISVISWFLGIPLVVGMIIHLIASSSTDDDLQRQGIAFILGRFILPLLTTGISTIAVFLGSVALPVVFIFVPVMAIRAQETNSFASTLNFVSHIKFVLRHLGDYVVARVLVFAMIFAMHVGASIIGGMTVWIIGIGFLLAWFFSAAARFWSRLAWAYFLANMRMNDQTPNINYQIDANYQNYQNQQIGMHYVPANQLTPQPKRYHHWENN